MYIRIYRKKQFFYNMLEKKSYWKYELQDRYMACGKILILKTDKNES